MAQAQHDGCCKLFWCSSSTWVFSELPKLLDTACDLEKLASINNLFTGEFDSVLFQPSGQPKCIDGELGLYMQPKPITELDRLSYVVHQIINIVALPKMFLKYIPSGELIINEAFKGLSRDDSLKLENWHFSRKPTDPEICGRIQRGEQIFSTNCLETVANDCPKNAWSIQSDVTKTLATLKSHLWPGFMAYHRCNTDIVGFVYMGDGICNSNLPFMV